jgi:hypothetical protein
VIQLPNNFKLAVFHLASPKHARPSGEKCKLLTLRVDLNSLEMIYSLNGEAMSNLQCKTHFPQFLSRSLEDSLKAVKDTLATSIKELELMEVSPMAYRVNKQIESAPWHSM